MNCAEPATYWRSTKRLRTWLVRSGNHRSGQKTASHSQHFCRCRRGRRIFAGAAVMTPEEFDRRKRVLALLFLFPGKTRRERLDALIAYVQQMRD